MLASILNVPLEQKETLRATIKEGETYDYAFEIALDWWMKNTSEASWKALISSVDKCEEKDAAHAMRKMLSEESNHFCNILTISPIILGDKIFSIASQLKQAYYFFVKQNY